MEDELGAGDESLLRAKFELKHAQQYKDVGVLPGVLVEENKRRKILKELGVELRTQKKEEEPVDAASVAEEVK